MLKEVESFATEFLKESKNKPIRIISHFDSDGITSASIITRTLQRLDKKFSTRIVKGLDEEIIKKELSRQKKELILFLDLASNSLDYFNDLTESVFIIDHHEIHKEKLNENIKIINPHLTENPKENETTTSGLSYFFSKAISEKNTDLGTLAMVGIIGDRQEKNPSKLNEQLINEIEGLTIKKGLALYPATRPLKRTLEYSTSPYIPNVTGNTEGVIELLKECEIPFDKSLLDLSEEEMSRLLTSIVIRKPGINAEKEILSNLYVIKFFNSNEDVREISTLINACSRQGNHDIAISYCLQSSKAKTKALDIYTEYKHEIVSGLKTAEKMEKIRGENFVILNAKDKIKDAIIGTICSMISSSAIYKEGTILIGMAYNEDKIKVSARTVGRIGRNLKELMEKTVLEFKAEYPNTTAEVGGHQLAAGCLVDKEKEEQFLEALKKNLEIEIVKV